MYVTYIYIYMYGWMDGWMDGSMYVCVCVGRMHLQLYNTLYTYIYININININKYIYIHTYNCIRPSNGLAPSCMQVCQQTCATCEAAYLHRPSHKLAQQSTSVRSNTARACFTRLTSNENKNA